jgi:predicted Zn-dependent protease
MNRYVFEFARKITFFLLQYKYFYYFCTIQSTIMKHLKLFFLSILTTILVGCGTTNYVPITGRSQSLIVSDEEVLTLSYQQYQQYMQSAKPSTNAANTEMVRRVGQRLANAVMSYLNQVGLADDAKKYAWEFNLVQNQQVNAFCMPGGKIVVYEGILPVTRDEASLAIVLGHEIAHAVAKHSAERLSNAYKQQYGVSILGAVAQGAKLGEGTQALLSLGTQLGSSLWTSGFSRKQESEADHMGLIFAAMAGYDPNVAVSFWQRMAAQGSGSGGLFSDHPSDAKRVQDIQKWLPEALKYYKKAATTTSGTVNTTKTIKISSKKK